MLKNQFNRFTARLNNDLKINDYINTGVSISFANSHDQNVNLGSAYNNAYRAAPIIEPRDANGLYGNTSLYQNVGNPILDINNNDDKIVRNRLQSSGFLEIKPLKFLTFRSSIGGDLNFTNENIYNVKFDNDQTTFILPGGNQRNPNSNLTARFDNSFHWVFDNIVTFEKQYKKIPSNGWSELQQKSILSETFQALEKTYLQLTTYGISILVMPTLQQIVAQETNGHVTVTLPV